MKNNTKKWAVLIALLLLQFVILIYFGSLKKGMHFDECFSYFNTNNSVGRMAYDRSFVSSDDIMKDFYVLPGEEFNYKYVVTLQSYDVHPPVFYLLLHTVCSFMPGVFSLWQGLGLNIIYSLITTVFLFLSINKLIEDDRVSFAIILLYIVNSSVICNVMYIRMYCLMALWISISVYLHFLMKDYDNADDLPIKYAVINGALAYVGFLTHYFYLVFLFFIEAAFFLPKLFKFRKNYKGSLKYLGIELLSGILAVLSYPSCLGHVNSGYRGTEVKSYLTNLSDFGFRFDFFNNLFDKYVFNKMLYFILVFLILLFVMAYYKSKKNPPKMNKIYTFLQCLFIPFLGYYVVSVKASLLGDEAMMRYQLPVYGIGFIIIAIAIYAFITYLFSMKRVKKYILLALGSIWLLICVFNLANKNVFYLYQEQESMEKTAMEHSDEACIYIYNDESMKYLLWNDALQLAKYSEVYFASSANLEPIDEEKITQADKLVVYVSTLGENNDFTFYEDFIMNNNKKLTQYKKLYEAMYATVYEFY